MIPRLSSGRALMMLALIALLHQISNLQPVECYTSKKFLSGFLIALLLASRGGSSSYSAPASYPSYQSYSSTPNIFVIPTNGGY